HLFHFIRFHLRLQFVLKVLCAKQVQPVPRHAPQRGVDYPGGKLAVRRVKKRTQRRHEKDQPPPPEALGEGLSIPGEECHRLHHRQIKQTSLDPPVDSRACSGCHSRRRAWFVV